MGVYDDGDKTGGEDDESAGAAGAGDITVCVCNDGDKAGDRVMGQLERRTETISGEFNSQTVANSVCAFATMGTKPGEQMMG